MANEKEDRPDLQLGTRVPISPNIDRENEIGFIKFYKNLSEKDPSTIRIFERSVSPACIRILTIDIQFPFLLCPR